MNEIGNKIKARRLELGLTLEDVAKAVGVGRSTVQRWESGLIKNMGRDKIAALATILQINPVDLVPVKPELVELTKQLNSHLKQYNSMVSPDMAIGQFISKEDESRLEMLHQNPQLGILFDRVKDMPERDVAFLVQMAERMSKDIYGDD